MTGMIFSVSTFMMAFYCFCNGPKNDGYILMGFSMAWYILGIISSVKSENLQIMRTYFNKKEGNFNELDR